MATENKKRCCAFHKKRKAFVERQSSGKDYANETFADFASKMSMADLKTEIVVLDAPSARTTKTCITQNCDEKMITIVEICPEAAEKIKKSCAEFNLDTRIVVGDIFDTALASRAASLAVFFDLMESEIHEKNRAKLADLLRTAKTRRRLVVFVTLASRGAKTLALREEEVRDLFAIHGIPLVESYGYGEKGHMPMQLLIFDSAADILAEPEYRPQKILKRWRDGSCKVKWAGHNEATIESEESVAVQMLLLSGAA